jgi:FtsH-binding integral membrane protein
MSFFRKAKFDSSDMILKQPKSLPGRVWDYLALLGSALLLIALGTGSFLLADKYHIYVLWIFLGWMSLLFFVVVGSSFRRQFKSASFVLFFLVWMLTHLLIYTIFLIYSSWFYWLLILPIELWIGYTVAYARFGLPPDQEH